MIVSNREDFIFENGLELFMSYDGFSIFKTPSGKYFYYNADDEEMSEVEVVGVDTDMNKPIEELLSPNFDYDISGEELCGTNYYYFNYK